MPPAYNYNEDVTSPDFASLDRDELLRRARIMAARRDLDQKVRRSMARELVRLRRRCFWLMMALVIVSGKSEPE